MLLRIIQQLTAAEGGDAYDDANDGSHLPMVQPVRELQRRIETLDTAAMKYRSKTADITSTLQSDLVHCDDPEVKHLTENLMRVQHMLCDYLEGLHPILRDQKEAAKQLSEYLTPPTVELFQKKASHILKDAPMQQVSKSKRNRCTICMDASADCVIKRTCCSPPPSSSSSSSHHRVHCERDMCKCGPTMCKDCLLTHYWTSTGKGSKSYARCVCCRAGKHNGANVYFHLFCHIFPYFPSLLFISTLAFYIYYGCKWFFFYCRVLLEGRLSCRIY